MTDSKYVANVVFSLNSDHLSPRMLLVAVNFSDGDSLHFETEVVSGMTYHYSVKAIIGDVTQQVKGVEWLTNQDLMHQITGHLRSGNDVKVNGLGICGAWPHRDQTVTKDAAPEPRNITPAITSLRFRKLGTVTDGEVVAEMTDASGAVAVRKTSFGHQGLCRLHLQDLVAQMYRVNSRVVDLFPNGNSGRFDVVNSILHVKGFGEWVESIGLFVGDTVAVDPLRVNVTPTTSATSTSDRVASVANMSQVLKTTLRDHDGWMMLTALQRDVIEMTMGSLAEIVHGAVDHVEIWKKIHGYTGQVVNSLTRKD